MSQENRRCNEEADPGLRPAVMAPRLRPLVWVTSRAEARVIARRSGTRAEMKLAVASAAPAETAPATRAQTP